MAANHLHQLDRNLKNCYTYDFDWMLLPISLRKANTLNIFWLLDSSCKQSGFHDINFSSVLQMCSLFGKALKQRDTFILFGLIVLTSFCMGHACVNVQNAFWKGPVIVWTASVITTGIFFTFTNETKFCPNQFGTEIRDFSPNCYYWALLLDCIIFSPDQFMRTIKLCHLVFTQSELVMFVECQSVRSKVVSIGGRSD